MTMGSEIEADERALSRAWEIHKDADAQLQSRLSSFATSQSFLVTGYIVSLDKAANGFGHYMAWVSWLLAILGIAYAVSFLFVCNQLIGALDHIKREYLLPHDRLYSEYTTALWTGLSRRKLEAIPQGWRAVVVPAVLPALAVCFWILVIVVRIVFAVAIGTS
jgi:hypothetical protein